MSQAWKCWGYSVNKAGKLSALMKFTFCLAKYTFPRNSTKGIGGCDLRFVNHYQWTISETFQVEKFHVAFKKKQCDESKLCRADRILTWRPRLLCSDFSSKTIAPSWTRHNPSKFHCWQNKQVVLALWFSNCAFGQKVGLVFSKLWLRSI